MKSFLELVEEKEGSGKHAVLAFGRMNPPTAGHEKVINKVKEVAAKHNAEHHVVLSHTTNAKKDPLSQKDKIKHAKRAFPNTNIEGSDKEHPTIFHHAEKLHKQGVTHLHVVAGSDRVKEYKEKLNSYNGKADKSGHVPYNFKKITVHSSGSRDPDAEGAEGMSGTKMREHAKSNKYQEFKKGLSSHMAKHEAHAKELYKDVRKGMGINEDVDRGIFKAIFVTGGPGSGKDIVIREAISESRIVELNFVQAIDYLADKQKLSEQSKDMRREAIRNRGPLIVNGPADDNEKIEHIKEELEELGYETMMVFVDTSDEASKERNSLLSRMMIESVRRDKWAKSQRNTKYFTEAFKVFVPLDNTGDIDSKEEDIHQIYESTNEFLDSRVLNETAEDWLCRNNKSYTNYKIESLFKEDKNVQISNKFLRKIKSKTGQVLVDNNSPVQQIQRKAGKQDDVRDGDLASNSGYTFRAYEASDPKIKIQSTPKEPNFQQDKEKTKSLKRKTFNDIYSMQKNQGLGIGATFNSRSGVGVGLGDQTYSEQKAFGEFRKEAIDDPGAYDMGVGGTLGGATNKEPLVTPNDNKIRATSVSKKKRK